MPDLNGISDTDDLIFVTMRRGKRVVQHAFDMRLVETMTADFVTGELLDLFTTILESPDHVD